VFKSVFPPGFSILSDCLSVGVGLKFMLILSSLSVIIGCSSSPSHPLPHPPGYGGVVVWHQGKAMIPGQLNEQIQSGYQRLLQVRADIEIQSIFGADAGAAAQPIPLRIIADPTPNAFAVRNKDQLQVVRLNAGLIDLIGYDQAAMAFVLAHEIGHIELKQLSDDALNRNKQQDNVVELLGTVADIIFPMSSLLVIAGSEAIKAGYSRDQERDADHYGLVLMQLAGFDPQGAVRFQQRILHLSDTRGLTILASHPNGEERIANLQYLIEVTAGRD
jgi:predicted Zn-dependent protease